MAKFNKLDVPHQWKDEFTKYPHGYTIFEALCKWTKQVDDMVDNQNKWNDYLDNFVETFEFELQSEVQSTLTRWQDSGKLDDIISHALNTQIDELSIVVDGKLDRGELKIVSVENYGAVGDGVNDDTSAIQNALSDNPHATVIFPYGTYRITSDIIVPHSINIDGNNSKFILENDASIKMSGTITENFAEFNSPATEGDTSINISNENVQTGDILVLIDTSPYSFSNYREYFHAGEMVEVKSVLGNNISLTKQLEGNYSNESQYKIHLIKAITLDIRNINISGSAMPFNFTYIKNSKFENIDSITTNANQGMSFVHGYNIEVNGCNIKNFTENTELFGYGIAFRGCQNVTVRSSQFYARRHASVVGAGGTEVPVQTSRHISFYDCQFTSSANVNNAHAADFHGIIEDGYYYNCKFFGGVVLAGRNVGVIGGKVISNKAQGPLYFREVVSGTVTFKDIDCTILAGTMSSYHSSTEMDNPKGDITYIYENITARLKGTPSATKSLINIAGSSNDLSYVSVYCKNIVTDFVPNEQFLYLPTGGTGSNCKIRKMVIENIYMPTLPYRWYRTGKSNVDENTRITLPDIVIPFEVSLPVGGEINKVIVFDTRFMHNNSQIEICITSMSAGRNVPLHVSPDNPGLDGNNLNNYNRLRICDFTSGLPSTITITGLYIVKNRNVNPVIP